ncbi:MAG: glycosyltransferase [Candidatus Nezhaarchaeota archaeon]|nr:glycosyltransferase [Candidatus Nezhaarchaeota archaeon]
MDGNRYITIVIPTHNSEGTLPKVLDSLASMDYDKSLLKVVIVDDGSNDRTLEIAEDFRQRRLRLFHSVEVIRINERVTTSKVRNEGVKRAMPGSHLMFLDSDVILKPTTLTELLSLAENDPRVGAVGVLYLTSDPSIFEKAMYFRYMGKVSEGPAGTGALLVKREVLEKVGLFNESLGYPRTVYEDLEYVLRIRRAGYKVLIDGRSPLLHLKPLQRSNQGRKRGFTSLADAMRHYLTYFSFTKAHALSKALKAAPIVYKLEYVAYAATSITLLAMSLFSPWLFLLTTSLLLGVASFYSVISYRGRLGMMLRMLAGPAILISRLLRALTLTLFMIYLTLYSSLKPVLHRLTNK